MNDPDQTVMFSSSPNNGGAYVQKSDGLDDAWTDDDFNHDEDRPVVERGAAFVSLAFITAALKRSAWVWCATAVFGLLVGYALYLEFPPAYSATTSILISNSPNLDPTEQAATNVALAGSQAVAQRALKQLGLNQSVGSFIAATTVTDPSNQVIVFQTDAPSSAAAVQRATALANAFLQFRASYLENQQQLQVTLAEQQVGQAQQRLSLINQQIAGLQARGASAGTLASLQTKQNTAANALNSAQQNVSTVQDTGAAITASMVKGSQILNSATAARRSFKQGKVFYLVVALIAGLAIGMAIIVIRALVSSRLRNRDDVADAIGAPVMLSTGQVGANWLPPLGRRRASVRGTDVERIVAHLNGAIVPPSARRFAALAVVAVDNAPDVALAVVSLAMTWADQGRQVVLADLSDGAAAARRLGVKGPGVHPASARGVNLKVSVPGRAEPAPAGPLPTPSHPQFGHVDPDLAAACGSADLLLTLVTLNPVSGGDHLASWATEAVAVVTAGKSTATRIRAVGEMVRIAGARLVSVVLLKTDKSDESLGVAMLEPSVPSASL